ncbi:hypothetical protein I3843_06G047000 [Carya illinoinensis]|nr:hypothetical protein I3843_06G047000 [Carya illinoinensis]
MALRNIIFFTIFLIASLISLLTPFTASQNVNVLAIFAFGDSTIAPGNNNHIQTLFRSDHPPYGIDFPSQVPARRFCDGKLVKRLFDSSLGIKELWSAYLDDSVIDTDLLFGVSFAWAGLGWDPQTVRKIVENALFLISIGSNDMLFNYYDIPTRALDYSLPGYHQMQLQTMYGFIESLYKTGARRIAVASLPPIGCIPAQVTIGSKPLPQVDSKIPRSFRCDVTLETCCGTGLAEAGPLCNQLAPTCPDASEYIFFDSVHLTEAAYRAIADVTRKNLFQRREVGP